MKLAIRPVRARLSNPFHTASGPLHERELVLVSLEDSNGRIGWGEAAALEVPAPAVVAGLDACRVTLERFDGFDRGRVLSACAELAIPREALAAVDLALWDLAGHQSGQPVWRLLGVAEARPVALNATIAASDRPGAAREAGEARRAGFGCLKVKVGLGDDAGRLAAVRAAAGVEMAIRIDANGAWTGPEATAALRALAPVGLELCEEPVHGLAAIAELSAASPVPIAIDETTREPGALDRRACTAVCLKLARCGGISATIEAARAARAVGYEVYLASMLDGPLGIAGALHAATAIAPDRACGLATAGLFERGCPVLSPRDGAIAAPPGPGLGEGLIGWYRGG